MLTQRMNKPFVLSTISAALRGEYRLGAEGEEFHSPTLCPVCQRPTLNNYYICQNCGWEYDQALDNEYSCANGATLCDYRNCYLELNKLYKTLKEKKDV